MSTINPQPHGGQLPPGTRSQPAYEFPKRKRWADLLLSDLVDNVAFVLSPTFKILYCGSAVTEILGWRDMDLSDLDLIDLVPSSDQSRFRIAFEEAIRGDCEFDIAVRLRTNLSAPQYTNTPAQEVLFEMKVYPHLGFENDPTQSKCIFAMIPPYPSRNTALLNTMLDLKAENDRMSLQVTEYRSRLPAEVPTPGNSPSSQSSSMYATSSLHSIRPAAMPMPISHNANDLPGTYTSPALISDSFDAVPPGVSEGHEYGKPSLYSSSTSITEDQGDEGSKKKKAKKAHNAEQYVCITCGRTDSPEWRKGPLGPKTLCNACGLRWAKQMRKVDDPADGSAAAPTIAADS